MSDHHHPHDHEHGHAHGHSHGIVDPSIATSERGLWAIKWSFVGLVATAVLRLLVVFISGSDGAEPRIIDGIRRTAGNVPQVKEVTEVRARWHRLHAELSIAVDPPLTIAPAHAVAAEVRHRLLQHLDYLSLVIIHVDPADQSGEAHHRIAEHTHDGLPAHSHG